MVGGIIGVSGCGRNPIRVRAVFQHVASRIVSVMEGDATCPRVIGVAVYGAGQAAQGVIGVIDGDDALARPAWQGFRGRRSIGCFIADSI